MHLLQSRVHSLRTFPSDCYVKREDELGFGITGPKLRKYSSLIPFFLQEKMNEVVVVGSAYSNHVMGISQLLIENGIRPILYLLGNKDYPVEGNLLFTKLLTDSIRWVSREEWPHVLEIAKAEQEGFVLPEGGFLPQALPGAMTLATDIARNEEELGFSFDHIFIDAGTGLSAIGLLLGGVNALVHVLLLADGEKQFLDKLHTFSENPSQRFVLHRPKNARSFGSVNRAVFDEIQFLAKNEGFFTDPIYSAKLFLETRLLLSQNMIQGTKLIIHSGGAHSLHNASARFKHRT